jgi:acyl carrier protein
MSDSDNDKRVIELICQQLEVSANQLAPEASFVDDLKADSLAVVELVLALEAEFNIEIPDEDTEKIRTVKDALTYIQNHVES